MTVNGRVDDDLLRPGGRVNSLDDRQREGVVEAERGANERVRTAGIWIAAERARIVVREMRQSDERTI